MDRVKPFGWILACAALAGAFLVGARTAAEPRRPASRPVPAREAVSPPEEAPPAAAAPVPAASPALPPIDIRAKLQRFESEDLVKMEEEMEARVAEDPAFAGRLFEVFLAETDPVKMAFLQNLIASHVPLRNSPEWQDRFVKVAEADPRRERRIAALLFVQQAETIRAVRERLFALAETPGEVREHALIALKGLPDRRLADPRLAELAGRLAGSAADPDLRGLALRIEGNPERAARALSDPDRRVRLQAVQVAESREALETCLRSETDDEARALIERRLAELP